MHIAIIKTSEQYDIWKHILRIIRKGISYCLINCCLKYLGSYMLEIRNTSYCVLEELEGGQNAVLFFRAGDGIRTHEW